MQDLSVLTEAMAAIKEEITSKVNELESSKAYAVCLTCLEFRTEGDCCTVPLRTSVCNKK